MKRQMILVGYVFSTKGGKGGKKEKEKDRMKTYHCINLHRRLRP